MGLHVVEILTKLSLGLVLQPMKSTSKMLSKLISLKPRGIEDARGQAQ